MQLKDYLDGKIYIFSLEFILVNNFYEEARHYSADSIMNYVNKERTIEAFMIATCLIRGISFLFIYIQRGREPYLGYFSMANVIMAVYLLTMNNQLLNRIADYNFIGRIRIPMLAIMGVTIFLEVIAAIRL